ncbi:MAG: [FeFe] hydrogenase H-cluster radical SAM maturase HydE [Treponema sp.]|nr:[FeFe] hydrogenase H-cluster radical SAM maturase HydE [Treponema sp.]
MTEEIRLLIETLAARHSLPLEGYRLLVEGCQPESAQLLAQKADEARRTVYGNEVFARGLIEISSYCRNDCLYCGIRRSNTSCRRYRLSEEDILSCADEGYSLGFRTFVLQGGEDPFFTDERLCLIVRHLKEHHPDCAVTLSLGERSDKSFRALKDAGADRYLLRHETADKAHYGKLHPAGMSFENRMRCLRVLRECGFQTGCGFMAGSPFQTSACIAKDLKFIEEFKPDMCGIGPFIPHHATPFAAEKAGSAELTCVLLSIIRLIHPPVLLPATTALGTLCPDGRERGIRAGANVVMPNLSPPAVRKKYELYNGKLSSGAESAQETSLLRERLHAIGFELAVSRGDVRK